jgi:isochorismatase
VHDMQRYFVRAFELERNGQPLPDAQINIAIANIRRLLDAAHAANIPVYYTAQPPRQNPADRRLLTDFWGDGLQDDENAQILDELAPTEADTVLTKWRYSAFVRSPLEEQLKDLGRDQLIIGGVYAHIGCLTTALEAFMRDIQPFMVADALADFTEKEHRMACEYASGRCARVLNTAEVLENINTGALVTADEPELRKVCA